MSSTHSQEKSDVGVLESAAPAGPPVKRSLFRTTFVQATILGCCSFLAPGIWGAMSSTGGGGTQSVSVSAVVWRPSAPRFLLTLPSAPHSW